MYSTPQLTLGVGRIIFSGNSLRNSDQLYHGRASPGRQVPMTAAFAVEASTDEFQTIETGKCRATPARRPASVQCLMYPRRIVCLTEEPTEVLYGIGEQHRIVGISGYTVRPARARREKPRVSAFTSARIDRILALKPDLVVGFSDLQADIARELIQHGVEVWISNHRSVAGILGYISRLGALVGAAQRTEQYLQTLQARLARVATAAATLPRHPTVYFEEWDQPMISGIGWVSELIKLAGGIDIFPELAAEGLAKNRIVRDPQEVVRRRPQIILGSWCGKRFNSQSVAARAGWQETPAVRDGELHEIKSPIILQPGPAALSDGIEALHSIFSAWARRSVETRRLDEAV